MNHYQLTNINNKPHFTVEHIIQGRREKKNEATVLSTAIFWITSHADYTLALDTLKY